MYFRGTTFSKRVSVLLAVALLAGVECMAQKHNVLTAKEKADGWELLFDGKTLNGWRDYNGKTLTEPWHVVDGCIQAKGDGSDASGKLAFYIR